jgi:hypothetical protein
MTSPDSQLTPDSLPTELGRSESRLPTPPLKGSRESGVGASVLDAESRLPTGVAPESAEARPGTGTEGSSPREALEAALDVLVADLGDQEIAVLVALSRRLLAGQRAYGCLRLEEDRRDWRRERAEELADALVYGAFAEVAATLTRGTER